MSTPGIEKAKEDKSAGGSILNAIPGEALECGTSLAEGEFCGSLAPTPRLIDKSGNHNHSSHHFKALQKLQTTTLSSVHELRTSLSQDMIFGRITDGATASGMEVDTQEEATVPLPLSYSTFISPFEATPYTKNGSKINTHHQIPQKLQLPLVYCDHTASNRPVASLERYLQQECLPWYGNTHTNTSWTGSQSTALVAEARQLVAEACNAKITGKASLDVVLFTGNGATSAVELLIDCLGVRHAVATSFSSGTNNPISDNQPVVFVGPYEHHSNLIPWRESGCHVVMVPESTETGQVDLKALEHLLQQYSSKHQQTSRLLMGAFSAASNVTGKVTDVSAVAALCHRYGALVFADYATAAPYCSVNMNPTIRDVQNTSKFQYTDKDDIGLDALFWSPHKCLGGGGGTPGVLIVKKRWVSQANAPHKSGGGTVFYVTDTHHRFLSNRVERYEGGTPPVAGIWRLGLCILLKRRVEAMYQQLVETDQQGTQSNRQSSNLDNPQSLAFPPMDRFPPTIEEFDHQTHYRVMQYLGEHAPNLVLLGHNKTNPSSSVHQDHKQQNLPIFSFLVRWGPRFLHFNYVCAILNDLFGIQTRGGCQCSGPYSQRLLGLNRPANTDDGETVNQQVEEALVLYKERAELLRPGYTRLSLPFKGLTSEEVEYVVKALVWVSKHAWALMCQYRCNHRTGEWRHAARQGKPLGREERRWLSHYDPFDSRWGHDTPTASIVKKSAERESLKEVLDRTLLQADKILQAAVNDQRSIAQTIKMVDAHSVLGDDDCLERLRWYVYPKECALHFKQHGLGGGTKDSFSEPLLGAVNPYLNAESCSTERAPYSSAATTEQLQSGRKRKMDVEDTASRLAVEKDEESNIFTFRDGEHHQGEASLDEIEAGIDDGELSEQAEVFVKGEWVNAAEFVQGLPKPQTETVKTPEHETVVSHKKKAPRDHSMWGKGEVAGAPSVSSKDVQDISVDAVVVPDDERKQAPTTTKKKGSRHVKPPPKLMRLVTQAVFQWDMIQEGDRLLLGLSGGKDSLSLLHCLLELKKKLPTKFELEVCTIDPMTPSFDPSPLIPYVEQTLGLKYHYVRDDIVARASSAGKDGKMVSSLCAFCARMKRGNLYNVARQSKCNKLVLAQHLDDCAESFLMSVMHNGFLRTMKANYEINAGDLSVIRPMVYCRESLMTEFAKQAKLPVINENCPACFEEPKERARVKKLLSREELNYPNFYDNIRRSLLPLMHRESECVMHSFTEEAVAKSRKKWTPSNKRAKPNGANAGDTVVSGESLQSVTLPDRPSSDTTDQVSSQTRPTLSELSAFSDEQLMAELSRRKAARFRLAGAMKSNKTEIGSSDKMLCNVGGACSLFD